MFHLFSHVKIWRMWVVVFLTISVKLLIRKKKTQAPNSAIIQMFGSLSSGCSRSLARALLLLPFHLPSLVMPMSLPLPLPFPFPLSPAPVFQPTHIVGRRGLVFTRHLALGNLGLPGSNATLFALLGNSPRLHRRLAV